MAWRRLGDKPLFEPMMVILPTHICVTRPQWVKPNFNFRLPTIIYWSFAQTKSLAPADILIKHLDCIACAVYFMSQYNVWRMADLDMRRACWRANSFSHMALLGMTGLRMGVEIGWVIWWCLNHVGALDISVWWMQLSWWNQALNSQLAE